jgi:hypothetical protein
MCSAGHQSVVGVLPAGSGLPKEPYADEANGPAVSGAALLWVTAQGGMAEGAGLQSQPETGPAPHECDGAPSHLPAPQDQPAGSRAQGVPLPVIRHRNQQGQPGASEITYIPMARGFLYLVAIMDWYSRYVLAWRLSNTLEADFYVEALEEALRKGQPEIFNTDQGAQFTSQAFTSVLEQHGIRVSMDGKGWYTDNLFIFIERLWRSLKYEEVYLRAYAEGREARAGIGGYFGFYNGERPHQALGYRTPAQVFLNGKKVANLGDLVESGQPTPSAEPKGMTGPSLNSAFLLSN